MNAPSTAPVPAPKAGPRIDKELLAKHRGHPGELLSLLEALQQKSERNYLTREALVATAEALGLPLSQVFSVATFYSFFNLKPQGRHQVTVCRGTACHTRGSRALLDQARTRLGAQDAGDKGSLITPDGEFSVRTVACFGQCALAPVVEVDHRILGRVTETVLTEAVEAVRRRRS